MRRRPLAVLAAAVALIVVVLAVGQHRWGLVDKLPRGIDLVGEELALLHAGTMLTTGTWILPGVDAVDMQTESYRNDGRTTITLTVEVDAEATAPERDTILRFVLITYATAPFLDAEPRVVLTRGDEMLVDFAGHGADLDLTSAQLHYLHEIEAATGVAMQLSAIYPEYEGSPVLLLSSTTASRETSLAFLHSFDEFLLVDDPSHTDWSMSFGYVGIEGSPPPGFAALALAVDAQVPLGPGADGVSAGASWLKLAGGREAPAIAIGTDQQPGIPRPAMAAVATVVVGSAFPSVAIWGWGIDENGRATIGACLVPSTSTSIMDALVVDALLAPGVLNPTVVRAGLCDERS